MLVARVVFIIAIFASLTAAQATADLIITNAVGRTMDARRTVTSAVAVSNGRIVAVGSDSEIARFRGAATRMIDAKKRLVIPGFNDAHVHFTGVGNWFSHLDLSKATSRDEMLRQISHFTRFLPKGRWLLGGKLDPTKWQDQRLPTPAELDAVSPHNPVFLYFKDHSSAFVNSLAFAASTIPLEQKTLNTAEIIRDESGRGTGVVRHSALTRVRGAVPKNNATNWAEITEAASNDAVSLGVTSVQDVHSDNFAEMYRRMDRDGKLKARIYDCIGLSDWERSPSVGTRAGTGDGMVRTGCVKWMAEGIEGEVDDLKERFAAVDRAGLQIMVHAIGARSNANAISALEYLTVRNGKRDRRSRIEHATRMRRVDIDRLFRVNIIASMQPALFYGGGENVDDDYAYLLRKNVRLAFGSDASMIDIDPIAGIHAAVNSGSRSISVAAAVLAYTLGSAYGEF